jgi:cytoskeletal protein CcmA (bactofilin family)
MDFDARRPVGSALKEADMFGDRGQPDDTAHVATALGKGSQISGKLSFEGTVRIDGQVEGEIAAQESVVIGESAVVKAQVTADAIIITGTVTGDITARRRVEIRAPGKLYGNITTPSLVIHDGVVFEGRCSMGATDVRHAQRNATQVSAKEGVQEGAGLGVGTETELSASH